MLPPQSWFFESCWAPVRGLSYLPVQLDFLSSGHLQSYVHQNGPIHISNNYSLFENHYAWSTIADYVWIDQPVYVVILSHLPNHSLTHLYQRCRI
jgi:hypothetical protein